jgi:hypothetical protein
VADQRPAVDPHHLDTEPVRRPARRGGVHTGRHGHLLERGRIEDTAGVADQERGEATEVREGRPQLPRGGHHAGVVLRLGQDDVGPGVHRGALGGRGDRAGCRPDHAQGGEHLRSHGVLPGRAAQPRHQLAEHAEAQVGVVEAAGCAEDDVVRTEAEVLQRAARRPFPPAAGALRRDSGQVREQLPDGAVPERGAREMRVQRVVEVQPALVAQPHHGDGGDGLADRPEPVLHVGVRLGHLAPAGRPGQPAVAHDPGDQAGRAALPLRAGGARQEQASGRRQHGFGHVSDRSEPPPGSAGQTVTAVSCGSRPPRLAHRSNTMLARGGTEAASASSVVPIDQRSTRAATTDVTT